jgi:transcriptional regulator with XRE-family HTH domain
MVQFSEPCNTYGEKKMTIHVRIKTERERLGLSQTAFGAVGDVGKTTVIAWERGTAFPNAAFLAAIADIGADVQYIVTGKPSDSSIAPDEQLLLDGYRSLDMATRKHTLAFVLTESGPAAVSRKIKELVADQAQKQITVNAIGDGAIAAGKKITNRGKKAMIISGDNNSLGNK